MAKVFVVEDDLNIAQVYKTKIEEGEHDVEIVGPQDAVEKIKKDKPSMVLLDIMMPISGLDILREIKSEPDVSMIPILLLTNVADESAIEKGLEYGAAGYLLKSEVTPDQILEKVNATLKPQGVTGIA